MWQVTRGRVESLATTYYLLLTAYCLLLTTCYLLLTTDYLPPRHAPSRVLYSLRTTAYCLLFTTHYLLLTTYRRVARRVAGPLVARRVGGAPLAADCLLRVRFREGEGQAQARGESQGQGLGQGPGLEWLGLPRPRWLRRGARGGAPSRASPSAALAARMR